MKKGAEAGKPVACEGPFELADMQGWGKERVIRAAVLRYLLAVEKWPVDARGVRLRGVRIHGHLDLEGVTFRCSLRLANCYFDATEPVRLDHATAYRPTLERCHLAGLTGEMLSAREVNLTGATLTGPLDVRGANIAGDLICSGANLGRSKDGHALFAEAMKTGGDVLLDEKFRAAGTITLRSVRVGGSIRLRPAELAGQIALDATGAQIVALDATGAQITGSLIWEPASPVSGQVNLEGASVGHLVDDWGKDDRGKDRHGGFWPVDGHLRLDGFTYDRFGGDQQATVEQRLEWIRGQYPRSGKTGLGYVSQPYEQLAKVYRQEGKDRDARKVAVARRADLRQYGSLTWYQKAGNWFMDTTIRFGYQTWRAAAGLAVVFLAFVVMTIVAQHHHAIVPVSDLAVSMHPPPVATQCTPSYPCFYPIGYAVDVVIPIINGRQADYWGLHGWGWVAGAWAATALGWAAVTLLAVGYAGLVRQQ
jgi:hypothetical protein